MTVPHAERIVAPMLGRRLFAAALPRGRGGLGKGQQILTRAIAALLVSALVAFHLGLLWLRLSSGTSLGLAEILRWSAAAPLLAAFLALRRFGVPVLWGRKAMVLWLIVLVLHSAAVTSPFDRDAVDLVRWAEGDTLLAIPASIGSIALLLTAVWGLALAFSAGGLALPLRGCLPRSGSHTATPTDFFLALASRPPPIA